MYPINSLSPIMTYEQTLTNPNDAIRASFDTNIAQQIVGNAYMGAIGQEFSVLPELLKTMKVKEHKTTSHLRRIERMNMHKNMETQLYAGTYFDPTLMLGKFSIQETIRNQKINIPQTAISLAMYAFADYQNTNPMMFDSFRGTNFSEASCMLQFKHAWYDLCIDINMPFLLEECKRALSDQSSQLYNFVQRLNTTYLNSGLYEKIISYIYNLSSSAFWDGFYLLQNKDGVHLGQLQRGLGDTNAFGASSYIEAQSKANAELVNVANIARESGAKVFSIFDPATLDSQIDLDELIANRQAQVGAELYQAFMRVSEELGGDENAAFGSEEILSHFEYFIAHLLLKQIIGAAQSLNYKGMLRVANTLLFGTNAYLVKDEFDIQGLPAAMVGNVQLQQQIRNGMFNLLNNFTFDGGYNNMVISMANAIIGKPNYVMETIQAVDGSDATMTSAQISANTTLKKFTVDRFSYAVNRLKKRKADIGIGTDARDGVYVVFGTEKMLKGSGQFFDTFQASAAIKPANAQFMIGGQQSDYYTSMQFVAKFYNYAKQVRFFGHYGPFMISGSDATTSSTLGNTLSVNSGFHFVHFVVMRDSIYNALANPLNDAIANDAINNSKFSLNQHTNYYDPINNRYTSVAEHVTTGTAQQLINTNVVNLINSYPGGKPNVFQAHFLDISSYVLIEEDNGGMMVMPTKAIPTPAPYRGQQELMKIFVSNALQLQPVKAEIFGYRIEGIIPDFDINDSVNPIYNTGYFQ